MTPRQKLAFVSGFYLVIATASTWVAVTRGLPGRPFGIATGLPVGQDFAVGLGTALSAPLVLLLLLVVLNVWQLRTEEARPIGLIMILAGGFLVGMLAEPILGDVLAGRHDWSVEVLVVANLLVPLLMLAIGVSARSRVAR